METEQQMKRPRQSERPRRQRTVPVELSSTPTPPSPIHRAVKRLVPAPDAFEQAAVEDALNPDPAVEREISESAFKEPPPPVSTWSGGTDDAANRVVQDIATHQRNFIAAIGSGPIGSPPVLLREAGKVASEPNVVSWVNNHGQRVTFVDDKSEPVAWTTDDPRADPANKRRFTNKPLKPRRMRTAIGQSVQANSVNIILSVASLVFLIDDKLASLRDGRRNDLDALAEEIAHYESVKRDLEALRDVAIEVKQGKVDEEAVIKATTAFSQGVRNWWDKKHVEICDKAYGAALRTYDAALFCSCVSLCSLVGCGGPIAVAVSGALIGGKPVIEALKALRKG
jgi:hypothetical protein